MQKNRGMLLESIINKTIKFYLKNQIAIFHKKDIPIKFRKIDKKENKLNVKNAWIASKSTSDYYGVYDGSFVAFEAKSIIGQSFPVNNIKKHQINYLIDIEKNGGISFLIVLFSSYDEFFLIKPKVILMSKEKNLQINFFRKNAFQLTFEYPGIIDFVHAIKR